MSKFSSAARRLSEYSKSVTKWYQGRFDTKGMTTEGGLNGASTTDILMDGGKKNRKAKKHQKGNEEMLDDPTPSEALTFHPRRHRWRRMSRKGGSGKAGHGDIRPAHECGLWKVQDPRGLYS